MDSNSCTSHLENSSINGDDYIRRVISMDPQQLHNEICGAAEDLRRKHGITDVSVNPWFYLIPPKPRRDKNKVYGVNDLWKLYDASGEDTDSDEEDRGKRATMPENSSQKESGVNNAATSDDAGALKSNASPSSGRTEASKKESNKSSEIVDLSSASRKKNKKPKKNKALPSAKMLEENLPAVNFAKEREEKLHSLYGKQAGYIKAQEDWLKVKKMNYADTCNSQYWPCEPLNHSYAFRKLQVQH